MIVKIQLPYHIFKTQLPTEQYARLREAIPTLPVEQPIEEYHWKEYHGNFRKLMACGTQFEVKPAADDANWIGELADTIEKLAERVGNFERQDQLNSFNKRVSVHVPNSALLEMKQAVVFTDACTDVINEQLLNGWRILAICPQPDSRRPDYILGHADPNAEN